MSQTKSMKLFILLLSTNFIHCHVEIENFNFTNVAEMDTEDDSIRNLAIYANFTATSTCGTPAAKFCKLTSTGLDKGLDCDICDSLDDEKSHSINNVISGGSTRWWQSEIGIKDVNVTIDLGQVFYVGSVYLRMGPSPRPRQWLIQKSVDGEIFLPWQFFAEDNETCLLEFGISTKKKPHATDEVLCDTKQSFRDNPLEKGEIIVNLIAERLFGNNFSENVILQKWIEARYIRLNFRKWHSLEGEHFTTNDQSFQNQLFYSLSEVGVYGLCICQLSRWSLECSRSNEDKISKCICSDNICGENCDQCCPGYSKEFHSSKEFICKSVCNCNKRGSIISSCDKNGQCFCLNFVEGLKCDKCSPGHWKFPSCEKCHCSVMGSVNNNCDYETGQCSCKENFSGQSCNICAKNKFLIDGKCEECSKCEKILVNDVQEQSRYLPYLVPDLCFIIAEDFERGFFSENKFLECIKLTGKPLKALKELEKEIHSLMWNTSEGDVILLRKVKEIEVLKDKIYQKNFTVERIAAEIEMEKANSLLNSLKNFYGISMERIKNFHHILQVLKWNLSSSLSLSNYTKKVYPILKEKYQMLENSYPNISATNISNMLEESNNLNQNATIYVSQVKNYLQVSKETSRLIRQLNQQLYLKTAKVQNHKRNLEGKKLLINKDRIDTSFVNDWNTHKANKDDEFTTWMKNEISASFKMNMNISFEKEHLNELKSKMKICQRKIQLTQNSIKEARVQLDSVSDDIRDKINLHKQIEIKFDQLKKKINLTRAYINDIKIPVQLNFTYLIIPKISGDIMESFEAKLRSSDANGIILANSINNEQGTYLEISLKEWLIGLKACVGIICNQTFTQSYVSKNQWFSLKLHVKEQLLLNVTFDDDWQEIIEVDFPPMNKSLSIIDPLYIGRFPTSEDKMKMHFFGCLKLLKINNIQIDLTSLDFKDGLIKFCSGTSKNSVLGNIISLKGKGFYKLLSNAQFSSLNFSFTFRTLQTDAPLIFLNGTDQNLFIELKNGQILFHYKQGNDEPVIGQSQRKIYNDGQWHIVKIQRKLNMWFLAVDKGDQDSFSTIYRELNQQINELSIGGTDKNRIHLIGCLKNINLNGIPLAWSRDKRSTDVTSSSCVLATDYCACISTEAMKINSLSNSTSSIKFNFKTNASSSIIIYQISSTSHVHVYQERGRVNIRIENRKLAGRQPLIADLRIDDGEWHFMELYFKHKVYLVVDDYQTEVRNILELPRFMIQKQIILGSLSSNAVTCYNRFFINDEQISFSEVFPHHPLKSC